MPAPKPTLTPTPTPRPAPTTTTTTKMTPSGTQVPTEAVSASEKVQNLNGASKQPDPETS